MRFITTGSVTVSLLGLKVTFDLPVWLPSINLLTLCTLHCIPLALAKISSDLWWGLEFETGNLDLVGLCLFGCLSWLSMFVYWLVSCFLFQGSVRICWAHHCQSEATIFMFSLLCLQRYLTEFRVIELKEFLRLVGLSQKGRKSDLFQRANELLIHGSPKIQHQIRDIYERSHGDVKHRHPKYGKVYSHMKGMMHHHTPKSELGGSPVRKDERSYILHPDVNFKPHPFYRLVDTIIRPTALGKSCSSRQGLKGLLIQISQHQTIVYTEICKVFEGKEGRSSKQTPYSYCVNLLFLTSSSTNLKSSVVHLLTW